jgi:GDP-fucose transporter C1
MGTTLDSLSYDSKGFLFGIFSSVTTALHAIVIKKSLKVVGESTMDLVYYNNVLTALLLLPWVIVSGELFQETELEGPSFIFLMGVLLTV